MAYQIKVQPAQLYETADALEQRAAQIEQRVNQTSLVVQRAITGGYFQGYLANSLMARYQRAQPTMETWPAYLREFATQLRQAAEAFEHADEAQPAGDQGVPSNWLADQVEGDGWILASVDGFDKDELLYQSGGTCTIYAMLNLLVASGVDISEEQAAAIVQRLKEKYNRHDGFPIEAAEDILKEMGIDYTRGNIIKHLSGRIWNDFKEGVSEFFTDKDVSPSGMADAKKFLVDTLKQGKAIYVQTEMDDINGLRNVGHAWTVLGVQTDAQGNVTQVLVSDNSGDTRTYNADAFIDDWLHYRHGNYIVL